MRVVIDTNVLVSAALRDRDPEAVVLHVVRTSGLEWVVTAPILDEYRAVLRRPKFALDVSTLQEWDRPIGAATLLLETPPPVDWDGDPGDAMLVACALAANADFLITGDHGLLGTGRVGPTLVATVSQFRQAI